MAVLYRPGIFYVFVWAMHYVFTSLMTTAGYRREMAGRVAYWCVSCAYAGHAYMENRRLVATSPLPDMAGRLHIVPSCHLFGDIFSDMPRNMLIPSYYVLA